MKKIISLLAMALSISAFAQDVATGSALETVLLNSEEVSTSGPEAILVRTNATPEKVRVNVMVPLAGSTCVQQGTRSIRVSDPLRCGYDMYPGRPIPGRRVCNRTVNGRCVGWSVSGGGYATSIRRPRVCFVTQSYCVSYGTTTQMKMVESEIVFNLETLAAGETETFTIKGLQESFGDDDTQITLNGLETKLPYKIYRKKNWIGMTGKTIIVEEEE